MYLFFTVRSLSHSKMSILSGVFEIHEEGGNMHVEYTSICLISIFSEYKRTYGNKNLYKRVNQYCKRKSSNR